MSSTAVKVAVRIRPLIERELLSQLNRQSAVIPSYSDETGSYCLCKTVRGVENFVFDHVFDSDRSQEEIFEQAISPLIERFYEGYNATLLAYGQTGAGKTYTLGMDLISDSSGYVTEQSGVVKRLLNGVFIRRKPESHFRASFIEIYQEQILDLLSLGSSKPREIAVHQTAGRIHLTGIEEVFVGSVTECIDVLRTGLEKRTVGQTAMNEQSSRSHAIFTLTMEHDSDNQNLVSKFQVVDLAGSERQVKTQSLGDRFREGVKINYGLFVLGNVISVLATGCPKSQHVPYRDSKLTRILQDCLGGNSLTLMIACVSPAMDSVEETYNTLQYASKARKIKNDPRRNTLVKLKMKQDDPALVKQLENECERLRIMLMSISEASSCPHPAYLDKAVRRAHELRMDLLKNTTSETDSLDRVKQHCKLMEEENERDRKRSPSVHYSSVRSLERSRSRFRSQHSSLSSFNSMSVPFKPDARYESLKKEVARLSSQLRSHNIRAVERSYQQTERSIQKLARHRDQLRQEREKLNKQKSAYDSEYERHARKASVELRRLRELADSKKSEIQRLQELRKKQDSVLRSQNEQLTMINREMKLIARKNPSRYRRLNALTYRQVRTDYRRKEKGECGEKLRQWFQSELDLFVRVREGVHYLISVSSEDEKFLDLCETLARTNERINVMRKRQANDRTDDKYDPLERRAYQQALRAPLRDISNCKVLLKYAVRRHVEHVIAFEHTVRAAEDARTRKQQVEITSQGNDVHLDYFEKLLERIGVLTQHVSAKSDEINIDEAAEVIKKIPSNEDLIEMVKKLTKLFKENQHDGDHEGDQFFYEYMSPSKIPARNTSRQCL